MKLSTGMLIAGVAVEAAGKIVETIGDEKVIEAAKKVMPIGKKVVEETAKKAT